MTLNTKNNSLSAGLYVHEDKEIIAKFKANEELVAKILGISNQNEIEWRLNDNKKSSRFLVLHSMGDMNDKDINDNDLINEDIIKFIYDLFGIVLKK